VRLERSSQPDLSPNTPVVNTGLAVGLRKEGFETRHLRIGQPEKIAHVTAPFWSRESRRAAEINAS
jgi:hypothetical protein